MVRYPDAPAVLKSFSVAGIPIAIVSNTGWSMDSGYAATGACERLNVAPGRTLMVGNNRLAGSGSICIGCHCLILPPVPPGATRGLRAAADVAGVAWVA
jgi:hypothetical protein